MGDAWTVVVTREAEWDETQRGRALALTQFEAGLCRCGCGLPMSIAHDPKQPFKVDTWVCYAGRAKTRIERQWEEKNKGPDGKLKDPGAADGLHHYVTPATEADVHAAQEKRRASSSKQKGASGGH